MITKPYDKDGLNPTKGTIGEYLYANWLLLNEGIKCVDPDLQKKGIDWRVPGNPYPTDVDVKFSDKLGDFFAVTYRNSSNIRMPYNKGCEATWLAIVTFDWTRYLQDNSMKDELILAHETRDQLIAEWKANVFTFTQSLLQDYVVSIVGVKVQRVVALCSGFAEKNSGESNTDSQGEIVATREGTDIYAAAHIKWSAIPETSKKVHYQNPSTAQHSATVPTVLTYKWEFARSNKIAIDEQGKTLAEMETSSLQWIYAENKKQYSTFYKKFQVSPTELAQVLEELITARTH